MALERPWIMQAAGGDAALSYSALDIRRLATMLFTSEGVGGPAHLQVTQRAAGANFTVDVAVGFVAIRGDDTTNQGIYTCQNTTVASVVIPAAPVSGTRVHRIVARIKDKLHNGSWSTYEWTLECLADSGSGTPALPDSAITLALVSVAAGQANVTDAHITDQRTTAEILSTSSRIDLKKFADSSGITNNTTLADDADLTGTVPAGVHYRVYGQIIYSTHQDADFKFKLVGPANATLDARFLLKNPSTTGVFGEVPHDRDVLNTEYVAGGAAADNGSYMIITILGWFYSGDGGTLKLQWAQNNDSGTATYVRGKSFISLDKFV